MRNENMLIVGRWTSSKIAKIMVPELDGDGGFLDQKQN